MKTKVIRAFILSFGVALFALVGFLAFHLTEDRAWLEAAVGAGILLGVLLLLDVGFAVISVKKNGAEQKRKHISGRKDDKTSGEGEEGQ